MCDNTKEELAARLVAEFRQVFGHYPTDLTRDEIEEEARYWDPFQGIVPTNEMPSFIDFVQARLVAENEKEQTK